MNWWKSLKGKVRFDEPLKNHTTFCIGGPAKFFIEPRDQGDLASLLKIINTHKLNLFIIGSGSNVLIADKGINGVVVRLSGPNFAKIDFKNNLLRAGSGAPLAKIISLARHKGLSGLEFLTGIPGSLGGALAMNAGISDKPARGKPRIWSVSDALKAVTVMDYKGKIKTLGKKDMTFGYRCSNLSKYIILNAEFVLRKKDKEKIDDRINRLLGYRKLTQDLKMRSAGCIFKNPKGISAGRLIDACGLKAESIGDICVSSKHANFILNRGKGKAEDVLKLMALIQKRVKSRFKIDLEPEIKVWQ